MRQPLSLVWRRMGVLLVDLQEEQRVHPIYKVAGFAGLIANARAIVLAARSHGVPVFHAAYRRDFALGPPRPFEPVAPDSTPYFSSKTDPLTEICSEVAPLEGEVVIHKNNASAFCEGNLGPLLREAGVEWLFIAGVWTEACIAASVRDAMALGLHVLLVKDACGSATFAMHQTAVLNIANRLYGGGVADTARTLDLLTGRMADVWMPQRPVPILFDYADAPDHYRDL